MVTLGLADMEMKLNSSFADSDFGSSRARSAFQWGGTIFALFLLLMNRTGRRSHMLTNLLVLYLFASFPTVLFELIRGQFGCWVAFLAVASNLFFPRTFPVSRFILFVITPDWLANRLRDDMVPGILCLIVAILVTLNEIRGVGGLDNYQYELMLHSSEWIENNTFQALSTCQAIQNQQPGIPSQSLTPGLRITVPLRCACPTKNQTDGGINYLLSYPIAEGESISGISELFGADPERTLEANLLSVPTIFLFTSLSVPLRDLLFKITVPSPPPPPPPPLPSVNSPPSGSSTRTWIYVLVGVLGELISYWLFA